MGLYERITGIDMSSTEVKIPPHGFYSFMAERRRGEVTTIQVISAFNLSVSDQAELVTLVARITGDFLTAAEIHDVLLIAELRIPPYNTIIAVKTRFGV